MDGRGFTDSENLLWSVSDVAQYLGVPSSAVYKMTSLRSGSGIPHIKIGGRLRFRKAAIDEWLDLWSVSPVDRLAKAKRHASSQTIRRRA